MAIKMNEPMGDAAWASFFVRIPLGAYLVMAGLAKMDNIQSFILQVQQFKILPAPFDTLYAILLPYLEVAAGGLLVLGGWTTLAAIVSSLLLLSYVIAIGVFPGSHHLFNKDIILLGASLSLLFNGGGAFSIDKFRKSG